MVDEAVLNAAPENELIRNTMKKADLLLNSYKNPVCSVSGGSDSECSGEGRHEECLICSNG